MVSLKTSVKLGIQFVLLVAVTVQGDMCGTAAPDPTKTCVSIRLPWNPQPMYFCTDKSKFRYRKQHQNHFSSHCGINTLQQDTLLLMVPWENCPIQSVPDSCANQQCAPPPHNRKCQTIEPNANQPWECCNNYFCEDNMSPETCHFKILEPSCNMPPQDKKNCIAFVDPYGCCPKFQCDGDARPGHCPAEVEAMRFMARFNTTNIMMMGPGGPMMMHPGMGGNNLVAASPVGQNEMHLENKPADVGAAAPPPPPPEAAPAPPAEGEAPPARGHPGFAHPMKVIGLSVGTQNQIACVGDFNCPGTMKCCAHDMNVYMKEGVYFFRNRNPTYGYCMEPVMNANMNTKTIKYVSQSQ